MEPTITPVAPSTNNTVQKITFIVDSFQYDITYSDNTLNIIMFHTKEFIYWHKRINCPLERKTSDGNINMKFEAEDIYNLFVKYMNRTLDPTLKITFPNGYSSDDSMIIEICVQLSFSDEYFDKKTITLEPIKLTNDEMVCRMKHMKQEQNNTVEKLTKEIESLKEELKNKK